MGGADGSMMILSNRSTNNFFIEQSPNRKIENISNDKKFPLNTCEKLFFYLGCVNDEK